MLQAGTIKAVEEQIFHEPMPKMPELLVEMYRVAYMYRRKYSDPGRLVSAPDETFKQAADDSVFICNSYGNCATILGLITEAYLDIERQYKVACARDKANQSS